MKISFAPGKIGDCYCYKHFVFMENTKEQGVLEILHRLKQIQVLGLTFFLIRNSLLCCKQIWKNTLSWLAVFLSIPYQWSFAFHSDVMDINNFNSC